MLKRHKPSRQPKLSYSWWMWTVSIYLIIIALGIDLYKAGML